MTRALVFDLDDTLYPRDRFVRSGFAAVATHIASISDQAADPVFATMCRAFAGPNRGSEFQLLCRQYGLPDTLIPELISVYQAHRPSLWLGHGVEITLRQLRLAGWRLGLLTNGTPCVQAAKVAALGLESLLDHIVYAAEHAPGGKPAAEPFLAVLDRLDVAAEQAVFVGDDPICDVGGARAVGMPVIRILRPGIASSSHADADAVADCIGQVPAIAELLLETVVARVA